MTIPAGLPWIKIKDFKETSLWISAINTTTNLPVANGANAELTELSEKGITLKLPATACALGHFLILHIRKLHHQPFSQDVLSLKETSEDITVTAKVSEIESLTEDRESPNFQWKIVTLSFYQFDEDAWKKLIREYSERQAKMSSIFKNIKD